jgi:hypothetical protein
MDAVEREDAESDGVAEENGTFGRAHWGALILLATAIASAYLHFILGYTVSIAAWLFLRRTRTSLRNAVVTAVALRAIFLFAEPRLSTDVHRYMWDGNELAHLRNPYARAPVGDPRINHPEIATIYPPHAEILFALAHQLTLWRLLLIACDIATLFLLPRRFALAYATFPPMIFEGAWSAHVEVVAALLLLIALTRRSGAALGVAIGVKLIPIAALPLMWRCRPRRRFIASCLLALAIPFIPFALAGPIMPGLPDYATRWIFNSPAYDIVFAIVDHIPLKSWFTAVKDPLHLEPIAHWVYFHVYSDFVTRGVLALIAIALMLRARRVSTAIASLLLCSPALHPWYWLVAIPCAFVERAELVIAFALFAPFSYLFYDGTSKLVVYALCFIAPLLLSAIATSGAAARRAATPLRKARDTSPT